MKVANSLHQNQRSLNILSFEKALGYHLERQAHRHQSSWQSAGHYPKICSKKRWNISSGVILSKSSPSILRVERPTYPITVKSLSSFQDFFQDEIEMRYKQFPQFIGYQQMLFPSLLVITHRGQKKYLQGIIGLAGNFYHGGVSRPVLTNSRTSSFIQSFSNTSVGFALAQESILSIMVNLLADSPTDTPRKTAIRKVTPYGQDSDCYGM